MLDAEERYIAEIARDCAVVLGPGSTLLAVERDDRSDEVRLLARYQIDGWECESTARGETIVEAHAGLRMNLLTDRIRLGLLIQVARP